MAAHRGESLTALVAEALARSLGVESESRGAAGDLQRDIDWARENRGALLRRYRGEYVAIIDEELVDHGREFSALAARVFARFGNRSVYMPHIEPEEPARKVRSPRLARP